MKDLIKQIEDLKKKIDNTIKLINIEKLREEVKKLDQQVSSPEFWDDKEKAVAISQRLASLNNEIISWTSLREDVQDLLSLAITVEQENDSILAKEISRQLVELQKKFEKMEFVVLFSEKYDEKNAIVAIHAGSGGTEAQDWAEMLLRMILRFCEKMNFTTRILSESRGNEAGIKSVIIEVKGRYAYGYLRSENGVHRLVRISPFDADKSRHTSFALIEVVPELDEDVDIKIEPKDLRIDTFTSSGHGGQSVNTTHSAVRIVHIPTGIMVTCQNERSQHQNKETAMKILKSKLHRLEEEKRHKEQEELRGEYTSAEWGNQIRSYVLHPYKMVKDHRTGYQSSNPEAVLNGELLEFVEAYLKWKRAT